jgi:DNA-binding NtrC family response regulator
MSGELVSLRLLFIAAAEAEHDLWRKGVSMASVPIDFVAQSPADAWRTLAKDGADICVLDNGVPDALKAGVIHIARQIKRSPPVFISAEPGTSRIDGANGMLGKPKTVEEARRLAEVCIRTKIETRVLIVDDSSSMRTIVRKILTASRFALDIHEADEGMAALSALRAARFGLVFLDYNMPGFNGLETLAQIKRENANVAVVMMTSTLDGAVADRARGSGALAFLKKPFYPADIDAVLERYYSLYIPAGAD